MEPGQLVTITEAPAELLRGLPEDDQQAIKACVGQPGTYVGIDPHGYVEIDFNPSPTEFRTIWVAARVVVPYKRVYPAYPLAPLDRAGQTIETGMRVRVVGVPDLSGMHASERQDTLEVFQHLRGTYKRIIGFDSHGCAEIFFVIRSGKQQGMHSVAIEPYLLLVPRRRQKI